MCVWVIAGCSSLNRFSPLTGLCAQPAFYTNRSQCSFKLGNYEAAQKDASEALKLDPKFGKGYLRLAGCDIVNGDFDSAKKNLQFAEKNADQKGALEVQKEKARLEKICRNLSEFEKSWTKKDWRGAVYYANQVLESAPRMHSMVARKAEALAYNKKVDEALNLMADLLRMDDKNVEAIFVRGEFSELTAPFQLSLP